jgi:hypothetical protein
MSDRYDSYDAAMERDLVREEPDDDEDGPWLPLTTEEAEDEQP